jgi:endoglucanase
LGNHFDAPVLLEQHNGDVSWLENYIAGRDYAGMPARDPATFTQAEKNMLKSYEEAWGSTVLTQQFIRAVKEAGFDSIRVPVTWFENLDYDNNIDPVWMARIKQVVGWILAEDMHCIINIHHDGGEGWLSTNMQTDFSGQYFSGSGNNMVFNPAAAEKARFGNSKVRFTKIWRQISATFTDFDHRLIFEGMNEVWGELPENVNENQRNAIIRYYNARINELNQAFVDTVRASGNYNQNRFLLFPTLFSIYDAYWLQGFTKPADTIADRLICKVHVYTPGEFLRGTNDNGDVMTTALLTDATLNTTFTDPYSGDKLSVKDAIDEAFVMLAQCFIGTGTLYPGLGWNAPGVDIPGLGVPVIIGEWGSEALRIHSYDGNKAGQNFLTGADLTKRQTARAAYSAYYMDKAYQNGIRCFYWDNGDTKSFGLFDRKNNTVGAVDGNNFAAFVGGITDR